MNHCKGGGGVDEWWGPLRSPLNRGYVALSPTPYERKGFGGRPLALIRLANAGSCPSRQRDCVASASRSAETKGAGSPPLHSATPALTMMTRGLSSERVIVRAGWSG